MEQVRMGEYFAETGICWACYRKRQKRPELCFGKRTKGIVLGYDKEAIECREFCPDRKVCVRFLEKKE